MGADHLLDITLFGWELGSNQFPVIHSLGLPCTLAKQTTLTRVLAAPD